MQYECRLILLALALLLRHHSSNWISFIVQVTINRNISRNITAIFDLYRQIFLPYVLTRLIALSLLTTIYNSLHTVGDNIIRFSFSSSSSYSMFIVCVCVCVGRRSLEAYWSIISSCWLKESLIIMWKIQRKITIKQFDLLSIQIKRNFLSFFI